MRTVWMLSLCDSRTTLWLPWYGLPWNIFHMHGIFFKYWRESRSYTEEKCIKYYTKRSTEFSCETCRLQQSVSFAQVRSTCLQKRSPVTSHYTDTLCCLSDSSRHSEVLANEVANSLLLSLQAYMQWCAHCMLLCLLGCVCTKLPPFMYRCHTVPLCKPMCNNVPLCRYICTCHSSCVSAITCHSVDVLQYHATLRVSEITCHSSGVCAISYHSAGLSAITCHSSGTCVIMCHSAGVCAIMIPLQV